VAALLAGTVISGCGGGQEVGRGPLHVENTGSVTHGAVLVRSVSYTTFDGSRVPALFAIPRAVAPRACLIWENGLHSTKYSTAGIWDGASRLGLAMFAIDLRDHGQRATSSTELSEALRDPARLKALVAGTVGDLKRATDYLWAQPECHHDISYAGLSLGGMIGSVFVAQDKRIRTAVLMSVPGSWAALARATNQILPGFENDPPKLKAALALLSPLDPNKWIGRISPRPLLLMIGVHDPIVSPAAARLTENAARQPKTVVLYNGGHIPFFGSATTSNAGQIAAFLLKKVVEPTYAG
jgi:alpha-beta hydrolase superfamily lysophospholipase